MIDWCVYVDDESGQTFFVKFKHKEFSHYVDWPGRFYKLINGELKPLIFTNDYEDEWQDKLPD
jgi:hypothetical protein